MIDKAAEALDVKADLLQAFDVEDPFHGHSLRGYLCRKPDHRYGALYLTHVNDEEEPQIVFATPKLHYPFDRTGTYRFPPARAVASRRTARYVSGQSMARCTPSQERSKAEVWFVSENVSPTPSTSTSKPRVSLRSELRDMKAPPGCPWWRAVPVQAASAARR